MSLSVISMPLHGLILFCLAYLIAAAIPGPGIASIVARVLSRGTHALPAYIAGFVLGDLIWFTLAATGMAVLAQTMHTAFVVLRLAGASYLLYLAYRMWVAPVKPVEEGAPSKDESGLRLFAGSLSLTLSNPKVMVFFLALLPVVIELRDIGIHAYLEIAAAICIILSCVLGAYSLAALKARRLFRDVRALRWLNRRSGSVMAGAAVLVVTQ